VHAVSELPEVLRVLAERAHADPVPGDGAVRADGRRVALVIEGGGMRGTISGGMALALHELGLVPAIDAVYGSSAGTITGAWLLSSYPEGLRGWADPESDRPPAGQLPGRLEPLAEQCGPYFERLYRYRLGGADAANLR
jgi:hypothetical protein